MAACPHLVIGMGGRCEWCFECVWNFPEDIAKNWVPPPILVRKPSRKETLVELVSRVAPSSGHSEISRTRTLHSTFPTSLNPRGRR